MGGRLRSGLGLACTALALMACARDDPPAPAASAAPARPSVIGGPAERGSAYAPAGPAPTLSPSVVSRALAAWPERDAPLAGRALAALLPPGEVARIELHDAGAEPRAPRRHAFAAGSSTELVVEIDVAVEVTQSGEATTPAVPFLEVTVALGAGEVKDGLARVELAIVSSAVSARAEGEREVAREMEPLVKKLAGLRAELGVSLQGLSTPPPTPPAGVEPEVLQLWSSVIEAVGDALVAFPVEPIGTGASWTVLDRLRRGGVDMLRKTRFTLVDSRGGELHVEGEVVELPIAGSAHDPSLPDDIELTVKSGLGAGKRRARLAAGAAWPLASASELSSELSLAATAKVGGGDTRVSRVKLTQVLRAVRGELVDAGAPARHNPPPRER